MSPLRVLFLLFVVVAASYIAAPAHADDLPGLLSGLAQSELKPAVEALIASDDPKAKPVLRALAAGTLYKRLDNDAIVTGEPSGDMVIITDVLTDEQEQLKPSELEVIALDDATRAVLENSGAAAPPVEETLDFAGAVDKLKTDSFDDKAKAIQRLTELGDPRAIPVLQALADGRLFVRKTDGAVIIGDRSGNDTRVTLAATAEPAGIVAPGDLDALFINNNLRNIVAEAVGRMGLLNSDAATRRRAADTLIGSANDQTLPLLRDALAKETDAGAKAAISMALASAEIADADKARRLAAIGVLSGSTDLRVRSMLQARMAAETDPEVKAAVKTAFDSAQRKLEVIGWAVNLFQGISLGSVLLLAAIGLAITFGVMGVINMAHGEMIMLGAYSAYVVQEVFRAFLPPSVFDLYLIAAIPVGFVVAGIAGIIIERGIIRFLYTRPLETLLATWGVSLMLQQLVRSIFGAPNKEVANPNWMTGGFELVGGFTVVWNRVVIILLCFAVLGIIALIMKRTLYGLQMRAVTQNRGMASAMGIPTARIDALTFALGSGIAGIAGVALSQIGNVSPNLGTIYIVDSFLVVVFGGVGSLLGTLTGAMGLGIANKILEPMAGAVLGKVIILVLIILFIQKRRRGLFALKGRSVET